MQRPVILTVFGILNIVFGVFSVFAMIATFVMFALPGNGSNPVIKIIHENPSYAAWMKISIPLAVISGAALVTSGIGLLRVKSWGRILSITYSIYAIVLSLCGIAMNYYFLLRPLLAEAQTKQGPEAAGLIGGAVGGTLGGCFGMLYPILLLIFMMRPSVVAACRPAPEPPPL